ncbi:CinA family nicotinamide mononucleotide deamidase-related protein [Pelovirga terrestris]|uniref:CinA-like protein n=1 Tax=Pelovirga terrestris TaxID=2771352 RepID=A0A8J6QP83_9BACT|nr:CinA family nicotinamide mononucleotide deamidase-related protein [Pelovirga terrestris]MBD1401512.1 CinA family nicotinamide mononucleotide deamidase-related protein [Pelovirga terrestris]
MPSFDIAILTTAEDLLSGDSTNSISAVVVDLLTRHGYRPRCSLAVSDNEKEIFAALNYLSRQARFVITSGGLGPGSNALTARAAARALGLPLVIHEEALEMVRTWCHNHHQSFNPANERVALLPQTAQLLVNPHGMTPGFSLHHNQCRMFFLPAEAMELRTMLEQSVLPQLKQDYPEEQRLHRRTLKLFGLSEVRIRTMIPGGRLPEGVSINYSHDFPLVLVHLKAHGEEADERLDQAEALLLQVLGDHLMAREGQTAEGNVGQLLTQAGLTLSLAESCTGGLLSSMLTRDPGASAFLNRAGVTYADAAKQHWLKVPQAILLQHGAVSEPCARAMAGGLRHESGTDLALAITGIAGPNGGTPDKPVGTVYLALASDAGVHAQRYLFAGDRSRVQRMSAFMALEWLRRFALQRLAD